jgi:imidazolonepropionase-like amidohydrolase
VAKKSTSKKKPGKSDIRVIKGGRLIDGTGGTVLNKPVIVIQNKRIKEIGTQGTVKIPAGAEIIDATKYTLMPGMFDLHVHIAAFNPITWNNYRIAIFEVSRGLQAYYTLFHAQLCFEMGFTTLRDQGRALPTGQNTVEMVALRDAIDNGVLAGPRLIVCGRAVITNSHLDLTLPRAHVRVANDLVADGPYELRRATREQLRHGADFIKTSASGGGGTDKEEPDVRNMTQEELDAIVDECHAFHAQCAVHCFTAESHRMCVRAGVDTIEHIVFTDDETIKMIEDANIPVIPTLTHRTDHAIKVRAKNGTPKFILDKMKKIQPYTFESFKKFHQSGVKLAMGTDTGIDPEFGENAGELEIYVKLGMTPMEAIVTATKNAAEAVRLDKDLGTIEKGKLADILAIDGNPDRDITVLQKKANIKMVMKEGNVFVDRFSPVPRYVIHPEPGSWKKLDNI